MDDALPKPGSPTPPAARRWRLANGKSLPLDRARLLAILNVTPDSFSDGGSYPDPGAAAAAAAGAIAQGADGLDIGGESTRPGAARIPVAEQVDRVIPALRAIRREIGDDPPISVDTTLSEVALAALDAGADAVNDVSAGTEDPRILAVAARRSAGLILMHRLLPPDRDSYSDRYRDPPRYDDVVATVRETLRERADAALAAGVGEEAIVVDPGLGFGKTVAQNLELIGRTGELLALGYPILSGASRKSFTARAGGLAPEAPPRERGAATVGLSVVHRVAGALLFRVHDVGAHARALRAAEAAMEFLPGRRMGAAGGA